MRRAIAMAAAVAVAAGPFIVRVAGAAEGSDAARIGAFAAPIEEPGGHSCAKAQDPAPKCKPAAVSMAVLPTGDVLYADRVDAEHAGGIFRQTERVHDAFETAGGRVLLGHADPAAWAEARAVSPIGPAFDVAAREAWAAAPWLAVERTEPAGAVEIAVPVRDRSGRVVAALSALAAAKALTEDVHPERAAVLLRAAKAAGQAVGNV